MSTELNFKVLTPSQEFIKSKKLINTAELSALVSLSIPTIQRLVRQKKIPAYSINGRTWLFDPEEVIRVIKKHRVN